MGVELHNSGRLGFLGRAVGVELLDSGRLSFCGGEVGVELFERVERGVLWEERLLFGARANVRQGRGRLEGGFKVFEGFADFGPGVWGVGSELELVELLEDGGRHVRSRLRRLLVIDARDEPWLLDRVDVEEGDAGGARSVHVSGHGGFHSLRRSAPHY